MFNAYISITLHNIPEGMAVGVAFGSLAYNLEGANLISACILALGIGLQNFPEGTAVSVPLREGFSKKESIFLWNVKWNSRTNISSNRSVVSSKNKNVSTISTSICSRSNDIRSSRRINTRKPIKQKEKRRNGTITLIGFVIMMVLDVALG